MITRRHGKGVHGEHVRAGGLDIWVEQVGERHDVLLIGGAGDTVESWQLQLDGVADRYRLTAFDNRGPVIRTTAATSRRAHGQLPTFFTSP